MVERRIISSFEYILAAKLRSYFRKSIWKYLLASVLFSFATLGKLGGLIQGTLIIWSILIILTLLIIYFDSSRKAKDQLFDANVKFSEDEIIIDHLIGNKEREIRDWSWIKSIEITNSLIILKLDVNTDYSLFLDRRKLNENEVQFFQSKFDSINSN